MASKRQDYAGGPYARFILLGAAFFLTSFGLVMIYSASSITAQVRDGSAHHYFLRQLAFIVLGSIVAWAISRFDYRKLRKMGMAVWGTGVALLVACLALGVVRGGARRWIPLGLFNLQPSELAKIACVIVVAAVALEWSRGRLDTAPFLGRVALLTGIPALLIMLQPDLGTTMTLVVAVALVLILGGIDWKWAFAAVLSAVAAVVLLIAIEPYRMKRIAAFLDPWADPLGKGYQTVQALLAFGTGGVTGVGLALSRQKYFYLPEAHTDFILAIIGEEVGLIGTLAVVVGIGVFLWAGFKIASGARDPYGRLIAGAITGMIAFQAILNMAAVTGLMPITGKPLPFVSYGGSSMLVTMISVGLILSVSEYGGLAPRAVRSRSRSGEGRREGTGQRRRDGRSHLSRIDGGRAARKRA